MNKNILEIENLKVTFGTGNKKSHAVRGVSFSIEQGDILGIVGESGSGKSVSMKAVLGLLPDNATVNFDKMKVGDIDKTNFTEEDYAKIRGFDVSMIFQDPMTALNPLLKIGKQLEEVILRHQKCSKSESKEKALSFLEQVGISAPKERMEQYPHELSGGMRQRVLIAMALACEPKLLIADEPTTALDVTIQSQILDLLKELQVKYNMSIALITHDMGVVASMCDKIAIMYGGLVMEKGTTDEIFYLPKHPYTKALLEAIPSLELKEGQRLKSISGLPPSSTNLPKGCPFADRCDFAFNKCFETIPELEKHSETQFSACFLDRR